MFYGVLLDWEGVLCRNGYPLPGAREALISLRAAGIPMRVVTNNICQTRAALVHALAHIGLEINLSDLLTPVVVAREYLIERQWTPHLLVHPAIQSEFADLLGTAPNAVLFGDSDTELEGQILQSALPLLTMVAHLQWIAEREALFLGKPSTAFFEASVQSLQLPAQDIVMVSSHEKEIRSAIDFGLKGLLVNTGSFFSKNVPVFDDLDAAVDYIL